MNEIRYLAGVAKSRPLIDMVESALRAQLSVYEDRLATHTTADCPACSERVPLDNDGGFTVHSDETGRICPVSSWLILRTWVAAIREEREVIRHNYRSWLMGVAPESRPLTSAGQSERPCIGCDQYTACFTSLMAEKEICCQRASDLVESLEGTDHRSPSTIRQKKPRGGSE